tara:strand:- start:10 stop:675 length:666 start_codon:yes stop_codon:yes gene_type:complete
MNRYTILIPINDEKDSIPSLIDNLEQYAKDHHQIIVIDDGSTDGSTEILKKCNFINLICLKNNKGKGVALKTGLLKAKYNKVIIFDGDLELNPSDISKLMILNRNNSIRNVFASRYEKLFPLSSFWDFGNYFFTTLFNLINNTEVIDALCCFKAFYINDLDIKKLEATKFDIDVEIAAKLVQNNYPISNILVKYNRRSKLEGKKLNMTDGWSIFKRILKNK